MAKYKHVRTRGKPRISVLRSNLATTNWSLCPSTEDDIEPFLAATAAALESEPAEHFSRLTIAPLDNKLGSCTAVIPVLDPLAGKSATKSEQKLLVFLQEAGVLSPAAGLEELSQWGQANELPYRNDLRREARGLYSNEVTKEILPGVSVTVTQYEGSLAHAAAQAVPPSIAGGSGALEPLGKNEQKFLRHLKQTRALPQTATAAGLHLWCRSRGLYRRVDVQCAAKAFQKANVSSIPQQQMGAQATIHHGKSARVEKDTARKADNSAAGTGTHRLNADDLLAWLQRGGSMTGSGTGNTMSLPRPDPKMESTSRASIRQHTSMFSPEQKVNIAIPGLAERLTERAGFHAMASEQPRNSNEDAKDQHGLTAINVNHSTGASIHDATQVVGQEEFRRRTDEEQLQSLKRRSLIAQNANSEDLWRWKVTDVATGEAWREALKRGVSE
ncbi:hypothetical protein CLAFUW4_03229 [Fulvia fulva]|uniref:Uncharacterized protein n=1 Tax=Passalora fulva TaxID=5499 RepID=A0A9Q8LB63_PASFU|nr:uncharacterized protein CLAFUR5_03212 [Fulvia fulva]UJO14179.1 hypothetical protein CLAFUR5_03212 [Fulvia fulva]WPV11064.1 hypothetical protein CLAFUW4_03229 [Fulvia fulva]